VQTAGEHASGIEAQLFHQQYAGRLSEEFPAALSKNPSPITEA